MKIALDITPHKDGVHCGNCYLLELYDSELGSEKQQFRCTAFNWYGLCAPNRVHIISRNEECLAAELEYAEMSCALDRTIDLVRGQCRLCANHKPAGTCLGYDDIRNDYNSEVVVSAMHCPDWEFDVRKAAVI